MLIGEISATHEFAKPYIELLEELALKIEIIYLEGNHDFNLSCFFKRVKIFNLQEQPIKLNLHTSKGNNLVLNSAFIKLAHGDIFFTTSFTIYSENIKKSLFACIFEFF